MNTYGDDLRFLQDHDKSTLELKSQDGIARAIVSPRYQGRVMTTTSAGLEGTSYGWINYDLISSGIVKKQFNPVGGEERFWLGPEGSQFSLYFAPNDSFNIENWQVPAPIDTAAWQVMAYTGSSATFGSHGQLTNHSGSLFDVAMLRTVDLLEPGAIAEAIGATIPSGLMAVGYRTINSITNMGTSPWTYDKGLISIWLLGMLTPSDNVTAIFPLPDGVDLGNITTDYFGEIPSSRLTIVGGVLLFKCDGKYRSKIGLPPGIASPRIGSYDAGRQILTIVSLQVNNQGDYVDSKWRVDYDPYKGDALNAYNDGPLADGSQLGPFYELESSSPVFPLKPGEMQEHTQITCHFEGDFEALNALAKDILGFDLNLLNNIQ
jgi:hypothetical protein